MAAKAAEEATAAAAAEETAAHKKAEEAAEVAEAVAEEVHFDEDELGYVDTGPHRCGDVDAVLPMTTGIFDGNQTEAPPARAAPRARKRRKPAWGKKKKVKKVKPAADEQASKRVQSATKQGASHDGHEFATDSDDEERRFKQALTISHAEEQDRLKQAPRASKPNRLRKRKKENPCVMCNQEDEDTQLLCDTCGLPHHLTCLNILSVPKGRWHCPKCVPEIIHRIDSSASSDSSGSGTDNDERSNCCGCEEEIGAPINMFGKGGSFCQKCIDTYNPDWDFDGFGSGCPTTFPPGPTVDEGEGPPVLVHYAALHQLGLVGPAEGEVDWNNVEMVVSDAKKMPQLMTALWASQFSSVTSHMTEHNRQRRMAIIIMINKVHNPAVCWVKPSEIEHEDSLTDVPWAMWIPYMKLCQSLMLFLMTRSRRAIDAAESNLQEGRVSVAAALGNLQAAPSANDIEWATQFNTAMMIAEWSES